MFTYIFTYRKQLRKVLNPLVVTAVSRTIRAKYEYKKFRSTSIAV
jgi:hypothetical protein